MNERGSNSEVLTEVRGQVITITINRPEKRNALSPEVTAGLRSAFAILDQRDDLRVGILTGAGGFFSSGMDLARFADGDGFDDSIVRDARPLKPLIAAVEGFAIAGGMELALACDLIVASRSARFAIPEVKRGILAAGGGLARLQHRIPFHLAMELAITGEPIDAARAASLGLVNRLTEPGETLSAANSLAASIISNGPLAVRFSKAVLVAGANASEEAAWERQDEVLKYVLGSADAIEGPQAFLQKRSPEWMPDSVNSP